MSLRRTRSHKIGVSNIDYRTKHDEESLKIFQPWKATKDFGSMGQRNYHNPPKVFRNLFSPMSKINTYKDLVNEYPDPRYFTTAKFYQANHIDINTKNIFDSERVANLEETFKGKDVFIGDSMGITDTIKQRKLKKKNLLIKGDSAANSGIEDHKILQDLDKMPPIEKKGKNERSMTQRNFPRDNDKQLLKIDNYIKKDNNLVDINKIKIIKQEIRKRYTNRRKVNKIFQQWAKTFQNKITIYDAYRMINSLFIPINYNETKELILSASDKGEEFLNLKEFSKLIYNDNEYLNDEPFQVKKGENELLDEEKQKNKKEEIITTHKNVNDLNNMNKLKYFISKRIITLIKNIKELSKEKYNAFSNENQDNKNKIPLCKCDYEKFTKAVKSLNPPESYISPPYLEKLFDEYKIPNENLIDIGKFYNSIYDNSCTEFLSKQKDNILSVHKNELDKRSNSLNNFTKNNQSQKDLFLQKKYDLDKQMKEKYETELNEKIENKKENTEINGTVPSTKWINHVFENGKEHYNILNRAEHVFSAKPLIREQLKINTRFGSNPAWRNTAEILVGDKTAATYISEKDRFNIDRNIAKDDKIKNEKMHLGRQNRIRTAVQKIEGNKYLAEYLKDERDQYSQLKKCDKQYKYEERIKNLNEIIE